MRMLKIQQLPNGKWHLTKQGVDMGIFDYLPEAEKGMQRIVNPTIWEYNEQGKRINELGEQIP